jgi:hypothetical protein
MFDMNSILKPTWCTFHSIYWESSSGGAKQTAVGVLCAYNVSRMWHYCSDTCFEHYLLILRRSYTNGIEYIACVCHLAVARLQFTVSLQPCQLALHARNILKGVFAAPPGDEQVMIDICSGPWFSINWMQSASRWFHYTDMLWCLVIRTLSLTRTIPVTLQHTDTGTCLNWRIRTRDQELWFCCLHSFVLMTFINSLHTYSLDSSIIGWRGHLLFHPSL